LALTEFLADKSAWARFAVPAVAEVLEPLLEQEDVATCAVIDLEVLFCVRSGAEHGAVRAERRGLPRLAMPNRVFERAIDVQGLLARRGQHRAASIPDLLIAATAEHHGVAVLHYDADFDLIAEATGQPMQWVVARGTVD
jgi:predicted nucleic acid-binding protein